MTKWEYATIERTKGLFGGATLRLPNGENRQISSDTGEVTLLLCELGAQGWEVVGCGGLEFTLIWTLKRAL